MAFPPWQLDQRPLPANIYTYYTVIIGEA